MESLDCPLTLVGDGEPQEVVKQRRRGLGGEKLKVGRAVRARVIIQGHPPRQGAGEAAGRGQAARETSSSKKGCQERMGGGETRIGRSLGFV